MIWSDGWNARGNRRDVLRGAAVAAVAGAALTACAGPAGSPSAATTGAAKPTTTFHGVTVVWAPWHNVAFNATLVSLFEQAVQPFTAQNPTIRVKFSPNCCNGGKLVTAALAGQAPDLSSQYNTGTIIAHGIALDLMPYVKEYNLNLADYSAGRISHWEQGGGLYGLPSYTNVYGMIVNTTALDKLGVALPSKKWTHTQARQTFEAATRTVGGRTVAGGAVACHHKGAFTPASFYFAGFGANYVDPKDPARCVADSPQAIAAGRWCYEQLLNGTATNISQCFPKNLAAGKTVIDGFGLCSMVQIATELRGFEWDFWPMPSMPRGPYTNAGPDSYVIPANSKQPKEAWELLHWMVSGTHWQTWQMKTMLGAPVLNSLWNQYYTTLRSVAPPLAHKDLEILNSLGHIHIRDDFKYNDPAATKILKTFGQSIQTRKMTVTQAFPLMTAQINALETAEARSQGKTAKPTARAGARATAKPAPA